MPRSQQTISVDGYVFDILMRDIVGHDHQPAVYLKTAPTKPTFVRSFAYATGPAYGLLLDQSLDGWKSDDRAAGGVICPVQV